MNCSALDINPISGKETVTFVALSELSSASSSSLRETCRLLANSMCIRPCVFVKIVWRCLGCVELSIKSSIGIQSGQPSFSKILSGSESISTLLAIKKRVSFTSTISRLLMTRSMYSFSSRLSSLSFLASTTSTSITVIFSGEARTLSKNSFSLLAPVSRNICGNANSMTILFLTESFSLT